MFFFPPTWTKQEPSRWVSRFCSTAGCQCCDVCNSLKLLLHYYFNRQEFLKTQELWKRNAFMLIYKMIDWCNMTPGSRHLVDEVGEMFTRVCCCLNCNCITLNGCVLSWQMLHSIFFLGMVNNAPYTPENIIDDKDMLTKLKEKYPRPFEFYLTQLPKRGPFSCVMDMVRYSMNSVNVSYTFSIN